MLILYDENIIEYPDTLEKRFRRDIARLSMMNIDIPGYKAYCYQRDCGLNADQLKTIQFMSWSDKRIDEVEVYYQENLNK